MVGTKPDTKPSYLTVKRAPGLAALGDALLDAAADDLRVAVITADNAQTIEFLREFLSCIPEDLPHTSRWTNGNQRISFPAGGEILFFGSRQQERGHVLDRVYATSFDAQDRYWPLVCTKPGGKVVLY